jgi:hypothetical protein
MGWSDGCSGISRGHIVMANQPLYRDCLKKEEVVPGKKFLLINLGGNGFISIGTFEGFPKDKIVYGKSFGSFADVKLIGDIPEESISLEDAGIVPSTNGLWNQAHILIELSEKSIRRLVIWFRENLIYSELSIRVAAIIPEIGEL